MQYCYSGTESLWYESWNRHVCRKGKCAADRHSRSTGVNPSRKQRYCFPSCLWSQAQRDTSDQDNSQNLGYWLTIRHRCICMWSWTEMLNFSFQLRAKTVWIPLRMSTETCRLRGSFKSSVMNGFPCAERRCASPILSIHSRQYNASTCEILNESSNIQHWCVISK